MTKNNNNYKNDKDDKKDKKIIIMTKNIKMTNNVNNEKK